MSAEIIFANSSRLSGKGRSHCRFSLDGVLGLDHPLSRADLLCHGRCAQPSEDCIQSDADLLFEIPSQFATEPTSMSDLCPVDATVQERWRPTMSDEFDEIRLDVAQRAFRCDWRNAAARRILSSCSENDVTKDLALTCLHSRLLGTNAEGERG